MVDSITISNVHFSYPKASFLLDVSSFSFKKSEICLITGGNGSGKTTLLKLCAGILHAKDADLSIFGEKATNYSLGQIGQKVGYLFQEPSHQLFCANVWDEMTFASYMKNEDEKITSDKALNLLQTFGLEKLSLRSPLRLSRGEKQRLALATILMNDVDFLILDEPTTGLDRENKKVLINTLDMLQSRGMGLALISHDREILEYYKNERRIVLENGKIIADTKGTL